MICRKGKMNDDDESRNKSVFYFKVKVEYVNDRKKNLFSAIMEKELLLTKTILKEFF